VSAKQFVEKIKTAIPKLLLLTDADSTAAQAQDEVSAGKKPNPYEGMLTATGLTDSELWKDARHQKCAAIYEKASGTKVIGPDELKPGPDGKRVEIYIAVQDFCGELDMFTQIAEKVGPNLTNDSWTKAVNSFGKIHLVPADIASLKTGKYDAADGFRLSAFDSSIQPKGDWKALTELKDASSA